MITCAVLGPVDVSVDGAAPPPELLWRKNLALLVYLACSPKRARARDHLVGLLWPDKPEKDARHSLNEALRIIRRVAGEEAVETTADQVHLAQSAVALDIERFLDFAIAGEWGSAAGLVQGEFLEGFAVAGASGFEDWLTAERSGWLVRGGDALRRYAEMLIESGQAADAAGVARRALRLDRHSEAALRALVRSLALSGDRTGALRAFDEFADRLHADLGAAPSAELLALVERVRRERERHGARQTPAETRDSRRLPLAGRTSSLGRLQRVWEACRAEPHAALGMITGPPGVGKTRLADEVTTRVRLDGGVVAAIRAVEADASLPWSGVIGLARGGLLAAAGLAAMPARALGYFATELAEWADRFPGAAERPGREQPAPPPQALIEALRAAAAEQPVCVLIDDAQWLDRESILALGATLRDLARCPIFILIVTAPQPPRAELDELQARIGRDVPGAAAQLEALTSADIRVLARALLPAYGESEIDRLSRRIAYDSAGLPLLAVELLHAVALGMDLDRGGAAWPEAGRTLDQTLPSELPGAVVGAVRVGFRRLPEEAQRVLQAVSVLGGVNRVSPEQLARATGLDAQQCTAALDELEWQRWLLAEPRGYSFVARIIAEIVAQDLTTSGQRRRLQEAAGLEVG